MKAKTLTFSHHGKAVVMDVLTISVLIATITFYSWFTELIAGFSPAVKIGMLISYLVGSLCIITSLFLGARYHSDVSKRHLYGHDSISPLNTFGEAGWKALGVWTFVTDLLLFSPLLGQWVESTRPFNNYVGVLVLIIVFAISVGCFIASGVARNKRLEKKT